jgi:hypothetical protein
MVILLSLNFPYENHNCPLMFCRAGQIFYGFPAFWLFLHLRNTPVRFGNISSTHETSSELRPALFRALVPGCSFDRVLCRIPYALANLHDPFSER